MTQTAATGPNTSTSTFANTQNWLPRANDHGHFDIRIKRDGTWLHQGDPIVRESLVRLFANVLHVDADGQHWLVTPVEKGRIDVDVAPLLITALNVEHSGDDNIQRITVTCATGHECSIDAQHPLAMSPQENGEVLPLVTVHKGLKALFNRSTYYELMDLVVEGPMLGIWSSGHFFALEVAGD